MPEPEHRPAADRLGERLETFRPTLLRIILNFLFGLSMVAGGLGLIGFLLWLIYRAGGKLAFVPGKDMNWPAVGIGGLPGIMVTVVGALLVRLSIGLIFHRVVLHANGFRYCRRGAAEDVLWADVAMIRETIWHQRPPLLHFPANLLLPKLVSTSYTVITNAGKEYAFSGDTVGAIERLGEYFRELANELALPWETTEEHLH